MPIILRLESSISENFKILEITTQLADYKLAFFINDIIGFSLKRINDVEVYNSATKKLEPYSLFYFKNNYSYEYFLLNKSKQENSLLPYFLMFIKGLQTKEELEMLETDIKKIDNIFYVRPLEQSNPNRSIKALNALIREINDISIDFEFIREKTNERIKVYNAYQSNEKQLLKKNH